MITARQIVRIAKRHDINAETSRGIFGTQVRISMTRGNFTIQDTIVLCHLQEHDRQNIGLRITRVRDWMNKD